MNTIVPAAAVNAGHQVSYWREEPHEVDMIVTGPGARFAVEIKSGGFSARDLQGLMAFVARYRDFRPLVIGDDAHRATAERAGIDFIRWQEYLLDGFPC